MWISQDKWDASERALKELLEQANRRNTEIARMIKEAHALSGQLSACGQRASMLESAFREERRHLHEAYTIIARLKRVGFNVPELAFDETEPDTNPRV